MKIKSTLVENDFGSGVNADYRRLPVLAQTIYKILQRNRRGASYNELLASKYGPGASSKPDFKAALALLVRQGFVEQNGDHYILANPLTAPTESKILSVTSRILEGEDFTDLKVGTKVHYTGDASNHSSNGQIVRVNPPTRWDAGSYDVKTDDGQVHKGVLPSNFGSGYGGHRYELGHKNGKW